MHALIRVAAFAAAVLVGCQTPVLADDDTAALRREVQQLREELDAVRRDVQDIRKSMGPKRTATGWEIVEGMTIHPEGAPQLGADDAPLMLIEFSDYQCPFCARHFHETMPKLREAFVDTGRLRYMVADFPIERLHPLALKASEAAHCAADQGKFWAMHDRLFQSQRALEPWNAHAEALGLDVAKFDECMSTGHYAEEIRRNVAQAYRAGVTSTPVFLLAKVGEDGIQVVRRLRGAAPFPVFKAEIEALLAGEAESPNADSQ
ncbi:MAG: thioredoxin domain-containing protein [Betaproteobacteria bacterium]|nr:thioredoxin domain-containing protein [Betaproteobacteria bacterium]